MFEAHIRNDNNNRQEQNDDEEKNDLISHNGILSLSKRAHFDFEFGKLEMLSMLGIAFSCRSFH